MYLIDTEHPIILLNPRGEINDAVTLPSENIRLESLLAYLRGEAIPVKWIDADLEMLTAEKTAENIIGLHASLVVLEVMYRTLPFSLKVLDAISHRMPSQPPVVVFWGIVPSLSTQELLNHIPMLDAIIVGEAEETLLELARTLATGNDWHTIEGLAYRNEEGKMVRNRPRRLISNLDHLPFPARDSLPLALRHNATVDVATSRGCYGVCTFCNIKPFYAAGTGAPWRGRSAGHIVEELEALIDAYDVHHFAFIDENFMGPGRMGKERAHQFAQEIMERHISLTFSLFCRCDDIEENLFSALARVGLRTVSFGLESASQRSLDYLNKRTTVDQNLAALAILRRLSIRAVPSLIMAEPTTSLLEVRETISFLRQHHLEPLISPTSIIPYPGTQLTNDLRQRGLLQEDSFILKPYIPAFRFADARVEMLLNVWKNWELWADDAFRGVRSLLARAYHIYSERQEPLQPPSAWLALLELLTKFKLVEGDVILSLIDSLLSNTFTPTIERTLQSANVPALQALSLATWQLLEPQPTLRKTLAADRWS